MEEATWCSVGVCSEGTLRTESDVMGMGGRGRSISGYMGVSFLLDLEDSTKDVRIRQEACTACG